MSITSTRSTARSTAHSAASKLPSWFFNPLIVGTLASVVLFCASFGGGATRNRGGTLEALGLSFISFGHGRNVSMWLYWVGIFGLVWAWVLAGRTLALPAWRAKARMANGEQTGASASSAHALAHMRRALVWWLVPLLGAAPLASRDVYSYLMQGAMLRDGFDPYTQGAAANPGPFLLEVSHDWRNTTTPYGPLHLWTGELITRLVGDNVALGILAYKMVSVLGFAAIAYGVVLIARSLGTSPTFALWLGVANPVMIIHMVGGMHNESVMVGLVSLGLALVLRRQAVLGIGLIALATSLKVTAFLAMPFVLWIICHHYSPRPQSSWVRRSGVFLGGGLLILAETIAVIAAVTWASGSSWGWLSEITGNSKVINPLAGPTLLSDVLTPLLQLFSTDITYNAVLSVTRTVSMAIMLLGLVAVWCVSFRSIRTALYGAAGAYQVAFVFNSVTLPWYYASVLSLVGAAQPPLWVLKIATGASIVVATGFSGDGNHQFYTWWWILAAAAVAWWATQWTYAEATESTEATQIRI
ncbi:alpha-(1-_6)-mannopyranosyltransferase A [Corynebacterium lizhenjunii]|uniref:alpha-(1->6)-mannopyranosyltransferase A n=1 Tax=Corynebacterium lizhenjunii TaxID=2709394 RepID=UPI0013ECC24B|nr:alpha-(1->6)-mannopyranosyltransferase A [Corynebacterium lizhenjunii]